MKSSIHILTLAFLSVTVLAALPVTQEPASDNLPNRPKVPGTLRLHLRERKDSKLVERTVDWEVSKTAIIIIDMWDGHY